MSPPRATVIEVATTNKYAQFLQEVGKEHESIRAYETRLQQVGSISPSMVVDVYKNLDQFDLQDERVRLILSVHYITLIDQGIALQNASWFSKPVEKELR